VRAAVVALAALALAGCGAAEEGDGGDAPQPEPAPPTSALEVTVWPGGEGAGPEESWTLECDPPGGTHPAPDAGCSLLAGNEDLLEPLPEDVMCTQQYGGPEQAWLRGTFEGRSVDLRYARANGCEIARWDRLAPLLETASG